MTTWPKLATTRDGLFIRSCPNIICSITFFCKTCGSLENPRDGWLTLCAGERSKQRILSEKHHGLHDVYTLQRFASAQYSVIWPRHLQNGGSLSTSFLEIKRLECVCCFGNFFVRLSKPRKAKPRVSWQTSGFPPEVEVFFKPCFFLGFGWSRYMYIYLWESWLNPPTEDKLLKTCIFLCVLACFLQELSTKCRIFCRVSWQCSFLDKG